MKNLILFAILLMAICGCQSDYSIGRVVEKNAQKDKKFFAFDENGFNIDIDDDGDTDYRVSNIGDFAWEPTTRPKVGQMWRFRNSDLLLNSPWPDTSARGRVVGINPIKIKFLNYPEPVTPGTGPIDCHIQIGDSVVCGPYLKYSKGKLNKDVVLRIVRAP